MSVKLMKEALESCEAFLLSAGFESSDVYAEVCAAIEQAEKQESIANTANRKFTIEDIARIFNVPSIAIVSPDMMQMLVTCRSVFELCLEDYKDKPVNARVIQKRIDDINKWIDWLKKAENQAIVDSMQDIDWQSLAFDKIEEIEKLKSREWIGLTDQEILDLADEHLYNGGKARDFIYHAHDIEAKLKEKNYVS